MYTGGGNPGETRGKPGGNPGEKQELTARSKRAHAVAIKMPAPAFTIHSDEGQYLW